MTKDTEQPVLLMWANGKAFLEMIKDRGNTSSFLLSDDQKQSLPSSTSENAVLALRLRFGDDDREFQIHAKLGQRFSSDPPGSVRLDFLAEEKGRQELVLAAAEGESIPYHRRNSKRLPCELPVRVRSYDGRTFEAIAKNISESGVYLSGDLRVDIDAPISLWISFSESPKSFAVSGRVASVIPAGPQRGAGIEFRFQSKRQRDELVSRVEDLRISTQPGAMGKPAES